jgi:outer membrane immunogenic protein
MVLVAAGGAQATEPTAYSWSGLYIGGNAGYTWGDVDSQYTVPAGPTGAVSRELDGGIYGAHIGLQHQWRSFVFSVEGSYSGSAGDKIDERGLDAPIFAPAFDYYARMNSMLTAGGRIGWTPMSNWLIYASGGYASAKIETNFILRGPDIVGGHDVERHSGFYIGGGIEYALTRNWIFGVEYLHVDLDSKLHAPGLGGGVERTVDPDFDVVRARISYKFGWDDVAAPLK